MGKGDMMEICKANLYEDDNKLNHLPIDQRERLKRIRSAYTLWNNYPNKSQKEILNHLMGLYPVEQRQAYRDIAIVQELLGQINKASKDWHRYKFNAMVQKAYDVAEMKQDPDAMQKAANTYAKYNQLDKEESIALQYEEINVQTFEPSEDPTLLGIKPIKNIRERIDYFKKKYDQDITDITYEEIDIQQLEKYANQ